MGLGLYSLGSGISAAKFFIARGAKVLITDLKSKKELSVQIKSVINFYESAKKKSKIKIYKPIFVLGKHRDADFLSADMVMKNPAVRAGSPYLDLAKRHGARIETDISLFFSLCAVPIVGITGTRGKSTTTTLAHKILLSARWNAYLGGNIQISPLSFINKVETSSDVLPLERGGAEGLSAIDKTPSNSPFIRGRKLVVLELSSWMLESAGDAKISPHVALITNMMPDHLNTYAGMADYIAAKENIFRFQKNEDIAILNRDNEITEKMGSRARARRFWFSVKYFSDENGCFVKNKHIIFRVNGEEKNICPVSVIKIPGEHNLQNILAAVCLTSAMGIAPAVIRRTVEKFSGIPNRLELVREYRGVKFYNDTTATTPDAVIAALRAIGRPGKVILIAGGADKNLDFADMASELKKHKVRLVLFSGKATDKLVVKLENNHWHAGHEEIKDMESAVNLAVSSARRGDIILLSPGAASFGLFQNEFDRGRQFVKIIKGLK